MVQNLKTLGAELAKLKARQEDLERENAVLKEMIQPKPQAPKPKVEPEGARFYTQRPGHSFIMPSDAELHQLLEIVLKHSPIKPPPDDGEGNFFRGFKQAFMGLGEIGRQPEINQKYDLVHWMERAREVCRDFGVYPDVLDHRAFWVAVLAHGDILFQNRDEMLGLVPAFGLANYMGTPAGTAWRSVLEHGRPLSSTKTFRQKFPLPEASVRYV